MSEMRDAFQQYAVENLWRDPESKSGPGSTLDATVNLRYHLGKFLRVGQIRSMIDAPCGDFNWMKAVEFPDDFRYIGGEIATALVEENRRRYEARNRSFIEFDITTTPFPLVDVWFCRDCLFHLPYAYILKALRNFHASKISWIMTSQHLNTTNWKNSDIPMAGFRWIDLYSEPFYFPRDVKYQIADYVFNNGQREMTMWTREQIGLAIKRMETIVEG